jgi:hypothetical protein
LANEAHSMYNSETAYPDLIIELHDGRSIRVHKAILFQANSYFERIWDDVGVIGVSIGDSLHVADFVCPPVANRVPRTRTARLSENST